MECPKHGEETYIDDKANERCYYCGAVVYTWDLTGEDV